LDSSGFIWKSIYKNYKRPRSTGLLACWRASVRSMAAMKVQKAKKKREEKRNATNRYIKCV
jgi:hypothetical protein